MRTALLSTFVADDDNIKRLFKLSQPVWKCEWNKMDFKMNTKIFKESLGKKKMRMRLKMKMKVILKVK